MRMEKPGINKLLSQVSYPQRGETVRCIDGICRSEEAGQRIRFYTPDPPKPRPEPRLDPFVPYTRYTTPQQPDPQPKQPARPPKPAWKNEEQVMEVEQDNKANNESVNEKVSQKPKQQTAQKEEKPARPVETANTASAGIGALLLVILTISFFAKILPSIGRHGVSKLCTRLNKFVQQSPESCIYAVDSRVAMVKCCKVSKKPGFIKLQLLQLEFAEGAPMKTTAMNREAEVEVNSLKGIRSFGPKSSKNDPLATIIINNQIWERVETETRYCDLVVKHHHYWEELGKASNARTEANRKLREAQSNSSKYIDSKLFESQDRKLADLLSQLEADSKATAVLTNKLGELIESLTMAIESIEDFGGLLLGYETPHEVAKDETMAKIESIIPDVDSEIEILKLEVKALD